MRRLLPSLPILLLVACGGETSGTGDINLPIDPSANPTGPDMGAGGMGGPPSQGSGGGLPGPVKPGPSAGGGGPVPNPGTGGMGPGPNNTGGADTGMGGETGAGGAVEPPPTGPYAPRTGPFKMLVYSRTAGFPHTGAINEGRVMLQALAVANDFEITITETNELITAEGLAQFEVVFLLNPTGDIFNDAEQAIFTTWLEGAEGRGLAGTHSMTDTEKGWAYYGDLTGQYYNGHLTRGTMGTIALDEAMLGHAALKGIPNPWVRNEEWYNFKSYQQWITKPGFQMLGRVTNIEHQAQPIMWIRENANYRLFYTALGHDPDPYKDAKFQSHVLGGILWTARREALMK